MYKYLVIILLSSLAIIGQAAEENKPADLIKTKLVGLGLAPDSVKPSPVEGLYEVMIGAEVVYLTADARFMVQGNLIDIDSRENLTEGARATVRKAAVDKIDESSMVVYTPKEVKHTITVFTDTDCGYCRKLHAEIPQYQDLGIKVRYMAFPRAGAGSPAFDTLVSVWCADDRNNAMDLAKQGKSVEKKTCKNPVDEQMTLGQKLGVSGTPAIVLDDGELIPGYQPAKRLAAMLDSTKKAP